MNVERHRERLLEMAERNGCRDELVELLTRHPDAYCELCTYLECLAQLREIRRSFTPKAIQALSMCGISHKPGPSGSRS